MSSTYIVKHDKEVALAALNETLQYPDKINIIYYYLTPENPSPLKVDFLYAIGKSDGYGPEHYSIVQSHEETLVVHVGDEAPDVSQLIYNQKALVFCNPDNRYDENRWYIVKAVPEEEGSEILIRHYTELTDEGIYRNLDDGFRWYFSGGKLKREDDFLTLNEILELIDSNSNIPQPTLNVTFYLPEGTSREGGNYYLPIGTSEVKRPAFSVTILDHEGKDITSEYTISVPGTHTRPFSDDGTEKYMILNLYKLDSSITVNATKGSKILSSTINLWFPFIAYYGTCTVGNNNEVTITSATQRAIYNNLSKLIIEYNLSVNNSYLLMPLSFAKFDHIYDINDFDYIYDYTYDQNFSYQDGVYVGYIKKDLVTISNFIQVFTFSSGK